MKTNDSQTLTLTRLRRGFGGQALSLTRQGRGESPCGSGVRAAIFSHRSTFHALRSTLYALLSATVLTGCATGRPRVLEVTATKHTETVGRADKNLFLTGRASKIAFESVLLPPSEQREEFYVRWTGAQVDMVKFEYRQVNVPNKVMEQTYVPADAVSPPTEGQGWVSPSSGLAGEIPRQARNDTFRAPSSEAHSPRCSWHVFAVRGDDFLNGGPVSAWRVSLWANGSQPRSERGKLLAEQTSALW
jgi:hypothetical protein